MNRGNRSRQDSKAKKDQKQKQDESGKTDESSDTSCKDITKEVFHSKTEETVSATEKMSQQSKHVSENATASTSNATNTENNQISPSRKRPAALTNELIAYVESIGDRKRNRKDTTNYSPVVFQVEDSNKRRAICFSETKRQLLVEKMNNRTALKLSKYNLAADSETVYINDMTYISNPRPEEYSFQFQETAASRSNQWMSLKDAIEQCEAMSLVNIKAKVLDVGEIQLVSQKRLQMAESIISDGTTTVPLILWEKDIAPVQKGKAFNFEQVRVRYRDEQKIFNTTKNTVVTENNETSLNSIDTAGATVESIIKTITVKKLN